MTYKTKNTGKITHTLIHKKIKCSQRTYTCQNNSLHNVIHQSSIITNVIHNVFTSPHNDLGCIHYMIRNPTDSCGRIGMDKVLSNSVLEQSHQLH